MNIKGEEAQVLCFYTLTLSNDRFTPRMTYELHNLDQRPWCTGFSLTYGQLSIFCWLR